MLYVPSLKRVLLAPHYWAQEAHDITPNPPKTWMATYSDCIILYRDQGKAKRTINISKSTNTPMTQTASGTKNYRAYSATIEALKACTSNSKGEHVVQQPTQQGSPIESDKYIADENLLLKSHVRNRGSEEVSADDQTVKANNSAVNTSSEGPDMSKIGRAGSLTFNPCPDSTHKDHHIHVPSDKQSELMHWHYRLGHFSFPKLKALAKIGEIPKHLANLLPQVCTGCAFGAMTRVPWKSRDTTRTVFKATKPVQCVFMDQMISTQIGFYAQLKGILTKQRYRGATVFVDHFSGYKYIHLMTHLSSEETVAAKRAFKRHSSELGVAILHYHADNG